MNITRFFIAYGIWLIAFCTQAQDIPAKPNPPRLVNDFVMKLQPMEVSALEEKVRRYADSTSTQISIVVVKTTQPYDPFDYGIKLANEWGIGQKGKNNGLLILWVTEDRKIRIFPGYGLEGALPDARCKQIARDVIAPAFKEGKYFEGLNNGIDVIVKYASGEFKADQDDAGGGISGVEIFVMILFFVIIIYIISRGNRGGGSGGRRYYRDSSWFPPVTVSSWGTSTGSGWGGGGGSDFGGFGGGSFGGGGAGSDY